MRTSTGIVALICSVAFVSFISLQPVAAQAPAGEAAQAEQKSESAKGELKSVDTAKMTLTLASGQTFMYNDQTKVTGAQGGVAGLASMSGREVTIQYTSKGADRIATSIEVAAAGAK